MERKLNIKNWVLDFTDLDNIKVLGASGTFDPEPMTAADQVNSYEEVLEQLGVCRV
jgi:hypothetical protein